MRATQEQNLTTMDRALWIVDHAVITPSNINPDGTAGSSATPIRVAGTPRLDDLVDAEGGFHRRVVAVDVLEALARTNTRGRSRQGLTARLWLALLIAAGADGQHTVTSMHAFATGNLPRETQWELGILHTAGGTKVRELTVKQLYNFNAAITKNLDTNTDFGLTEQETTRRERILVAIADSLVCASLVVDRIGSSYAVDETGVWAWTKAPRQPKNLPLTDPTDLDVYTGIDSAAGEEIDPETVEPDIRQPETVPTVEYDEDSIEALEDDREYDDEADIDDEPDANDTTDFGEHDACSSHTRPGVKPCWFAHWGVKTHKSGGRSAYYGYALHAMVRVADVIKGGGKPARTEKYAEPRLVEAFAVTSASTDLVDPTLGMVKTVLDRGQNITDLIGDRHYSYKRYDRWASRLWKLGIRQVLDLRATDLGPTDYDGAMILAGTPHLGVPPHLRNIERPGQWASKEEAATFAGLIAEREQYAMTRVSTAWSNPDGKTRWRSPARTGAVGCEHVPGSIDVAKKHGLPVIDAAGHDAKWCTQDTVQIPGGAHMKYQQQEYWGSQAWLVSFNRRTFIESVFGLMKSHHTGNIRRGFMCMTGRAMVTLVMAAAVVNYNLRELESWHNRATAYQEENPKAKRNELLDAYVSHPLHQKTDKVYGHTMLTATTQAELDARCIAAQQAAGAIGTRSSDLHAKAA